MKHFDTNGETFNKTDYYIVMHKYDLEISTEAAKLLGDRCYISVDTNADTKRITIVLTPAKDKRGIRIKNEEYCDNSIMNIPNGFKDMFDDYEKVCGEYITLIPLLQVNLGIPNEVYLEGVINVTE